MPGVGHAIGLGLPSGMPPWTPALLGSDLKLWLRPEELSNPNRLLQTEDLEDAAWNKSNITVASGQTDPDGGSTAFLLTATDPGGWTIQDAQGFQGGTDDVVSFWWKRGPSHDGTSRARLRIHDGVGFFADEQVVPPATWTRYELTGTLDGGATKSSFYLYPDNDVPGDQAILIWHPQLESGTSATTYVPNVATAGGVVGTWADQSDSSNDAVAVSQAVSGLVVANVLDGYSAALVDGVDDEWILTSGINLTAGFEIWAVVYVSANAAARRLFASTDASDLAYLDTAHKISTDIGSTTDLISNAVSTGQFSLLTWRRDGSDNLTAEENGVDVTNGTPSESGTLTINSLSDAADLWDEKIVETMVVNTAFSAAVRTNALGYLSGRYGTLGL